MLRPKIIVALYNVGTLTLIGNPAVREARNPISRIVQRKAHV